MYLDGGVTCAEDESNLQGALSKPVNVSEKEAFASKKFVIFIW